MSEQVTYPVNATVKQDGEVSVQHSKPVTGSPQAIVIERPVTGSPQAIVFQQANLTETSPQDGGMIADGIIEELSSLYEFRNDMVESFLEENPSLVGLLSEAYKIIPSHFGSEVQMALEVVADPEAPEDRELFVVIRTELLPMKARALLHELDQGWWREVSPAAEGKMEFALE
jgi:hypothetical protein